MQNRRKAIACACKKCYNYKNETGIGIENVVDTCVKFGKTLWCFVKQKQGGKKYE